jgi:uncharacterized protein YutE (UPF0331/DUF86 family)
MNLMTFEDKLEMANRLDGLMQRVGFAVWQLQELENAAATYLVVCVHAQPGIGVQRGQELLAEAEKKPLGALLKDLQRHKVIQGELADALQAVLEDRNWVVHRARRESRGVLSDPEALRTLMERLEALADHAAALLARLGGEIHTQVMKAGASQEVIDAESKRLRQKWGLEGL